MNKMLIMSLLAIFVTSCTWNSPPCPNPAPDDKNGLYARELGSVTIGDESCQIVETYKRWDCQMLDGVSHPFYMCKGEYMFCSEQILTRLTKCPSGLVSNTITYTSGKHRREQVQ